MPTLAEALRDLARLDIEDDQLQRARRQKPLELSGDQNKVAEAERKLKAAEAELKDLDIKTRSLETDLDAKQAAFEKNTVHLNQAKSNDEYQALQSTLARIKEESSNLETEILEGYDRREELEGDLAAAKEKLSLARGVLAESEKRIAAETRELEGRIAELGGRRGEALKTLAKVGPEAHTEYERVHHSFGSKTIVGVVKGVCQGCFVSLRPNDQAKLMELTVFVKCSHCGRVTYLEE